MVALGAVLWTHVAHAVRFTLGVETQLTPLVVEPVQSGAGELRLSVRPVLDVELSRLFAFGVYTPFTLMRGARTSESGVESLFGGGLSLRHTKRIAGGTQELMLSATVRGGLGTAEGRAGAFLGGALGLGVTWLERGLGVTGELSLLHLGIPSLIPSLPSLGVDRWMVSISLGFVFRLGGEEFWPSEGGP